MSFDANKTFAYPRFPLHLGRCLDGVPSLLPLAVGHLSALLTSLLGGIRRGYRFTMDAPKFGDALVIRSQAAQKPHHFNVAPAFGFQTPRRADLLQIAIEIKLQKIARIVTRPSRFSWLGTLEPKLAHLQSATNEVP